MHWHKIKDKEFLREADKQDDEIVRRNGRVYFLTIDRDKIILEKEIVEDDISMLRKEREVLMKQRKIFCNVAKRLYSHLNIFLQSSAISEHIHKNMLPFLEYKNIDVLYSKCESIVSCGETPMAHMLEIVSKVTNYKIIIHNNK